MEHTSKFHQHLETIVINSVNITGTQQSYIHGMVVPSAISEMVHRKLTDQVRWEIPKVYT